MRRGLRALALVLALGSGGLALWSAAHGVAEVLLMGFDFDDATARALVDMAIDASVDGLRRP